MKRGPGTFYRRLKSLEYLATRDRRAAMTFLNARDLPKIPLAKRVWLLRRFVAVTNAVRGYHTLAEILTIARAILERPRPVVLEAGCGYGASTAKLSLATRLAAHRLQDTRWTEQRHQGVHDSGRGLPSAGFLRSAAGRHRPDRGAASPQETRRLLRVGGTGRTDPHRISQRQLGPDLFERVRTLAIRASKDEPVAPRWRRWGFHPHRHRRGRRRLDASLAADVHRTYPACRGPPLRGFQPRSGERRAGNGRERSHHGRAFPPAYGFAPRYSEHTTSVLGEAGVSASELRALEADGIIPESRP